MSSDSGRELVVVLGPGRSGTSTMAGALARSGFVVPDALPGDESNPEGFYEPGWAVEFHTRLLKRAAVHTLDGDPGAYDELGAVLDDPAVRTELRTWLADQFAHDSRLVIKDPRLVWFRDLWAGAAADLAAETRFIVMLRHPAEVASSRSEFYDAPQGTAVAGWVNVVLMTERLTRDSTRAFVRYADLLRDWRGEFTLLIERLDLELDPPPSADDHPIEAFIKPSLRRRDPDWGRLDVPATLAELADRVYATLGTLADDGESQDTLDHLDSLAADYATLHADSVAIAHAHWRRKVVRGQRAATRKANEKAQADAAEQTLWQRLRGPRS